MAFTIGNCIESSGRISVFYLKLKCIKEHITVGMFYSQSSRLFTAFILDFVRNSSFSSLNEFEYYTGKSYHTQSAPMNGLHTDVCTSMHICSVEVCMELSVTSA